VPGATWLTTWPSAWPNAENPNPRPFVALLVTPPGLLIQRGDQRALVSCWDLGRELDATRLGLFVTQLPCDSLLLSEAQREAWGRPMAAMGRVFRVLEKATEKGKRR
jgi:hypothetical protein